MTHRLTLIEILLLAAVVGIGILIFRPPHPPVSDTIRLKRVASDLRLLSQCATYSDLVSSTSLLHDPFTSPRRPYEAVATTASALVYSVGPDRESQNGRVVYDPTNGATSQGDLVLQVAFPSDQER